MGKQFKTPFAFDENNQLIDIDSAIKGKKYKCSCGSELKVRGGKFISNHFYHSEGKRCSLESTIHKAYKEVFKRIKKIRLPDNEKGVNVLTFDKVVLEKKIMNYIPDAIGYIGDDMYLIEFAKTSFIGDSKLSKIEKSNLFCLEVCIGDAKNTKDIEDHLLKYQAFKTIIYEPESSYVKKLKKQIENLKLEKEQIELSKKKQRFDFTKAYISLKNENEQLSKKIDKASVILSDISNLDLFFKSNCKNGSKFFTRNYFSSADVCAFVKDKVLSIKIKSHL